MWCHEFYEIDRNNWLSQSRTNLNENLYAIFHSLLFTLDALFHIYVGLHIRSVTKHNFAFAILVPLYVIWMASAQMFIICNLIS